MTTFRWGIFGTGAVSYKFAAGLRAARDAEVSFVASRSASKAEALAGAVSAARAIEGYAAAATSGGVDAIYVATPPAAHVEHALLCINAGVPVLVEKPLALHREDAERIVQAARDKGVFVMEAMWTRFLPAAREMRDRVVSGAVGDIRMLSGSFGMSWLPETSNSLFQPALGGGALAHLGAYPLSLGQWFFGEPTAVQAFATVGATGVDEDVAIQVRYSNGVIGSFLVTLRAWAPEGLDVLGDHGVLGLRGSIVRPYGLTLSKQTPLGFRHPSLSRVERLRQSGIIHRLAQDFDRSSRRRGKRMTIRYAGNGYHYEADEVRARVRGGYLESDTMPLADSVGVAGSADAVRRSFNSPSTG